MASNDSRRSSCSNADSGISCNTTVATVNARYACYWADECRGQHEIDACSIRGRELRGKLGIYYGSMPKRFSRDNLSNVSLEKNPTGCTMVHLLIFKQTENNETYLLFATKEVKDKGHTNQGKTERQSLLTLPSSNPCKRSELQKQVARRALETVTNDSDIIRDLAPRLRRFLFVNASVIYPLALNTRDADRLMDSFTRNEEVDSLHWFSLSTLLDRLPEWNNYLSKQADGQELAQIRHDPQGGITLSQNNEQHTLWSVTATLLMCIRNFVGFEEFLRQ